MKYIPKKEYCQFWDQRDIGGLHFALTLHLLSKGIEAGLGEQDNSVVIEILRKRADNLTG